MSEEQQYQELTTMIQAWTDLRKKLQKPRMTHRTLAEVRKLDAMAVLADLRLKEIMGGKGKGAAA